MSQLVCNNLVLGYEGRIVVNNLSFSIDAGDYLIIVGENGSGKSTLMKTILGLKTPISGEIIRSTDLKGNDFGYLPQQVMIQKDFPATVKEVVLSGTLNRSGFRPFYTKAAKQLAMQSIAKLGISTIANQSFSKLSGGQQQRVLLARALAATQKILFLDEPVAGLDMKVTEDTYDILSKLNSEGITIVMVSHDITMAITYASHILHISNHEAAFFGTTEDYLQSNLGKTCNHFGGEEND